MTDSDWVSSLDPAPPAELATAIRNSLTEGTQNPSANDLLEAAEILLDRVLRSDCEARASALDLLTADALITHSLQLANGDPGELIRFADRALRRIALRG